MNIWFIHHYAYPPDLSSGTRHWAVANALCAKGHNALIVACSFYHNGRCESRLEPGRRWLRKHENGVLYHWLHAPRYEGNGIGRVWNMCVFAWRVFRQQGMSDLPHPDLIVGTSPNPFAALAASLLARRLGVPFVLEVIDLWPDSLVQFGGMSRWHPFIIFLSWLERFLYRRADALYSHLSGVPKYVVEKGVSIDRAWCIPVALPVQPPPPLQPLPSNERFIFLYAGAHGVYNHLDLILDAAEELQNQGWADRIEVHPIGDGPLKPQLKSKADSRELDMVRFFDPVPNSEIHNRMAKADAFIWVCPDIPLYKYGANPSKIYDYMLAGRPVLLGARLPNNPVDTVRAGLSVDVQHDPHGLAEAMKTIYGLSREERKAMGERGYGYVVENHRMDRWLESFLNMAGEVCGREALPKNNLSTQDSSHKEHDSGYGS